MLELNLFAVDRVESIHFFSDKIRVKTRSKILVDLSSIRRGRMILSYTAPGTTNQLLLTGLAVFVTDLGLISAAYCRALSFQ
jgi:hypothetical protein